MKNLIAWCVIALLSNTLLFSQNLITQTNPLSAKSATSLLAAKDAGVLSKHFTGLGYKAGSTVAEGTKSYSGVDSLGSFTISIATQQMTKSGAKTVEMTVVNLTRGGKTETVVLAEDDVNTYRVVSAKVNTTKQSTATTTKASLPDCFRQYGKGAIASCSSCINCIKNCINNNSKRWKKITCSMGCGSCYGCIRDVVGFVKCLLN